MTRSAPEALATKPRILLNAGAAASLAADLIATALAQGVRERGEGMLAVSGGRSPVPTFDELAKAELDWPRVRVTLVDERWVDPGSPDSNQRLVEEHLLQGPARGARFVPMKSSAASPEAGVEPYLQALGELPPTFDAVLLGMGEDGHFASLFPHSSALGLGLDPAATTSCVAVPPGADGVPPSQPRLSLTLSAIARARLIVLLTSGSAKLGVLQRALTTICSPTELPISALLASRPDTVILHSAP